MNRSISMETTTMASSIVNRVAGSGIITIDLAEMRPSGIRSEIDLHTILYMGMVLREKDFREWADAHDWTKYQDQHVRVHCSSDAIIPAWVYMIIAVKLKPYAASMHVGSPQEMEAALFDEGMRNFNFEELRGKKVCIKGCGEIPVPDAAFARFTWALSAYAEKIMYGEPCSSVPVYRTTKPTL